MTGRATITFSQPGVQGPVYAVTSISSPPWQPLELNPAANKTAAGDTIFSRHFDNVADGTYQYKIRIGQDHWIVDESMETATDDVGNRNNVVHVQSEVKPKNTTSTSEAAPLEDSRRDEEYTDLPTSENFTPEQIGVTGSRKDTALNVSENVGKDQPASETMETDTLPKDPSERRAPSAGVKPELQEENPEMASPLGVLEQNSTPAPLLIVEKTDDALSHGDDFGDNASSAQQLAHELRKSDATPDQVVVKHDNGKDPSITQEQPVPSLPHESVEQDSHRPSPGSPRMTIEKPSNNSFRDPASTNADDEIDRRPWLSLQTGSSGEGVSELSHSPLMSHESSYTVGSNVPSADELDQAPLLPHEMDGPRQSTASLRRRLRLENDNERHDNKGMFGSMRSPTFSHEGLPLESEDLEAPLLPHERDSTAHINHGPEASTNEVTFTEGDHQRLSFEGTSPGRLSSLSHPSYFRTRTSSSSLPHKLPQSDEEDENLHDPSLEPFPTSRDKILEQVVTIGKNLPEDEPHGTSMHSPHMTAMSQACSSIDLAPVKSYTSLQSVIEEPIEEALSDPPSPVWGASNTDEAVAQHDKVPFHKTSHANPLRTEEIDTPSKVLNPPTPPLTPEKKSATVRTRPSAPEQRGTNQETSAFSSSKKPNVSSSAADQDSSDEKNGGGFRSIFGAVCNPIGRLLSACFGAGGRKQTTGAVIVIGIAMAAYYVYVVPDKPKSVGNNDHYVRA